MNMMQIQYLLDAVRFHSIHKTAEKYNISPQGASKAIRMLEQELDIVLIERSTKGVVLTEYGEQLLPYFEELLCNYHKIKAYCNELNLLPDPETISGEINLAVTPRFTDSYLGSLLTSFNLRYPNIRIRVDSMNNSKIFQKMQEGKSFDIGIVTVANIEPNIEQLSSFLLKSNLQLISYCTKPLYICGLKKTIEKIGKVFPINSADAPRSIVAYEYGGIMEDYRADYDYQMDSITAQLNFINQHDMLGAYALDEFKRHFHTKKHAYIPMDSPVTLTYGSLMNGNHRLSEVEKIFLQFLYENFKE